MRTYFYTLFGIISAVLGWSFSQIFWLDIGKYFSQRILPPDTTVLPPPDLILLPIVATSLAVGMVITEIFLSNPTRHKANFRVLPSYFWLALISGIVAGLISAICSWIMYASHLPAPVVRVTSWGLIGLFTGLGESISWRWRSIEGATSKAKQRVFKGILFGLLAGLVAAILVEIVRDKIRLGGYEDPFSFIILGLCLGLFLSLAGSPSYQVALRAGAGFEIFDSDENGNDIDTDRPRLQNSRLRFVSEDDWEIIEEGLSIQLPSKTKEPMIIGSDSASDIYIPNLPLECASLQIKARDAVIKCLAPNSVQINRKTMRRSGEKATLKHNQILTLYHPDHPDKFYRFVFYDRFLDPQA